MATQGIDFFGVYVKSTLLYSFQMAILDGGLACSTWSQIFCEIFRHLRIQSELWALGSRSLGSFFAIGAAAALVLSRTIAPLLDHKVDWLLCLRAPVHLAVTRLFAVHSASDILYCFHFL